MPTATAAQYYSVMATANEVEKLALDLAERERAILATQLLKSLSAVLDDADEGMAEALRRDKDLDANPKVGDFDRATGAGSSAAPRVVRLVLHPKVYSDI